MNHTDNTVHDIEELSYHNNFQLCYSILSKWYDLKPTEDLKTLHKAFTEISVYVLHLQQRQRQYESEIGKWRKSTNRAIQRARKSEEQNDKSIII